MAEIFIKNEKTTKKKKHCHKKRTLQILKNVLHCFSSWSNVCLNFKLGVPDRRVVQMRAEWQHPDRPARHFIIYLSVALTIHHEITGERYQTEYVNVCIFHRYPYKCYTFILFCNVISIFVYNKLVGGSWHMKLNRLCFNDVYD